MYIVCTSAEIFSCITWIEIPTFSIPIYPARLETFKIHVHICTICQHLSNKLWLSPDLSCEKIRCNHQTNYSTRDKGDKCNIYRYVYISTWKIILRKKDKRKQEMDCTAVAAKAKRLCMPTEPIFESKIATKICRDLNPFLFCIVVLCGSFVLSFCFRLCSLSSDVVRLEELSNVVGLLLCRNCIYPTVPPAARKADTAANALLIKIH